MSFLMSVIIWDRFNIIYMLNGFSCIVSPSRFLKWQPRGAQGYKWDPLISAIFNISSRCVGGRRSGLRVTPDSCTVNAEAAELLPRKGRLPTLAVRSVVDPLQHSLNFEFSLNSEYGFVTLSINFIMHDTSLAQYAITFFYRVIRSPSTFSPTRPKFNGGGTRFGRSAYVLSRTTTQLAENRRAERARTTPNQERAQAGRIHRRNTRPTKSSRRT